MIKIRPWLFISCISMLVACGSDADDVSGPAAQSSDAGSSSASDDGSSQSGSESDAQTPPTNAEKLEAWLQTGAYKSWHCEDKVHERRSPSAHDYNRVCSNDLIAQNVAGSADWPKGAAAVKEIYDSASGTTPTGYAVYLKTASNSAGGASWYWYERVEDHVYADGFGDRGSAKSSCVGCHIGAGSDQAHTPSPGARDQVYTPVM